MKLSEFMNHINAALNYPAIEINDIITYCDMAMAELNTTLHISIPTFTKQLEIFRQNLLKNKVEVLLLKDPIANPVIPSPSDYAADDKVIYDSDSHELKVKIKGSFVVVQNFIGVYSRNGILEKFKPYILAGDAVWSQIDDDYSSLFDLNEYLPDDWILLWFIPYICFKYTVREGGTAQTFAEELTQGFQQLQDTYNVVEEVSLATVAGKEAYVDLIEENLPNLNKIVRTRAITESMKHNRGVQGTYSNIFDRGGF